ncbi:glycoside hydrolase superfamily [Microdochium bolleyi]|uniref:chitinase n=1 Tax=Microdochium bolleyi TaxID=196109 RepID=A0A136IY28_9PEZI|nr:glycoside hydrolase superfamily [Microdochium bolleyi]
MRLGRSLAIALAGLTWESVTPATAQSISASSHVDFPISPQFSPSTQDSKACPISCSTTGPTSFSWSRLLSLQELEKCDATVLFETMLRFPLHSPGRETIIKACTSSSEVAKLDGKSFGASALSGADAFDTVVDIQTGWSGPTVSPQSARDIADAASRLQFQVARDPNNKLTAIFAKSGKAVLGLYIGGGIHKSSAISLIQSFVDRVNAQGSSLAMRSSMQICGPTGIRSSAHIFGITADANGDLEAAHSTVRDWADGKCAGRSEHNQIMTNQTMRLIPAVPLSEDSLSNTASPNMAAAADECEYTKVLAGDSCQAIASRCDIPMRKLVEWNGGSDKFCNALIPRQPVCCSAGNVPDLRPKEQANGDCKVYEIQKNDGCFSIADEFYMKTEELHKLNVGKTWGWSGCDRLFADQKICVSKGRPPMPAPVKDVACGPQVPGTKRPADIDNLADLNPCPLKVCCSGWGYCGLTKDFCTDTTIDKTPGTAKPGTNGCISNCGDIKIINNGSPPAKFIRVGYFEGWNLERPCLNMDVTEVKSPITHIHFSFGHINDDFIPSIGSDVESQWHKFVKMSGPKKIISFGGWAFSNEAGTSHIMRQGVKAANRQRFANNIIKFVADNDLDGVDFDWEYPGADDIEGSDKGTDQDGPNYLKFLTLVRDGLPKDKSLAIAAPASYWYLRHFPIEDMAKVLDYIVYMTYDLHGQWDVGGKWATDGCEKGDCLRSHVNITETLNAMAMITRAGVQANKVIVGITSYGRSFKMANPSCWGPLCKYLGDRNNSPAQPGKCTNTGGYLANGEIDAIIKSKSTPFREIYDKESDSDIFIYNNVEWVGYMTDKTKQSRVERYKDLNFGGATDWASSRYRRTQHRCKSARLRQR